MKPRTDFDPMFQADPRRRHRPIRWIVATMAVTGLSGLALRAGPIPQRCQWPPPVQAVAPIPGGRIAVQGGVADPRVGNAQPSDRFVIVAPAPLDAAMVLHARDDIDPEMVFNPETGRRGSASNGPPPVIVAPVPGQAPDRAPRR